MKLLTTIINIAYYINVIGGTITGWWVLVAAYGAYGFLGAFGLTLLVSMAFKFGVAPLFMISASLLAFKFHVVDVWVPLLSYATAIGSLVPAYFLAKRVSESDAI